MLKQYHEATEQSYQVPKVEYITQVVEPERTVQVPKVVMVPQTTYETQTVMKDHTIQVPKHVFETRKRTIQIPTVQLVSKEIEEQVPAYETKTTTVQVPRTVMEPQVVTNYQPQLTQEPVTVQVPITQTQMVAQQINKVIEYKREPVNTYTVAGQYYPVGQPQFSGYATAGAAQATGVQPALYATGYPAIPGMPVAGSAAPAVAGYPPVAGYPGVPLPAGFSYYNPY